MTLNIKNPYLESLLTEVAQITGESKTEVVRKALEERRQRLSLGGTRRLNAVRLWMLLQDEIWPQIPAEQRGVRLLKVEQESILGYNEDGV